jgi:hypothetical protein
MEDNIPRQLNITGINLIKTGKNSAFKISECSGKQTIEFPQKLVPTPTAISEVK